MKKTQRGMFWLLLLFLTAGYFVPAIGITAIICMIAPLVYAPFKGRYWCGNYCPRGSFYDNVLSKFSAKKNIPSIVRTASFRVLVVITIFTVFTIQMYYAWGNIDNIGFVFWQIILVTTFVGIILGLIYNHRIWCTFCPMGTLANWLTKKPRIIAANDSCVSCNLCNRVCPLQLTPAEAKKTGGYSNPDCLSCNRCVDTCPKQALSV